MHPNKLILKTARKLALPIICILLISCDGVSLDTALPSTTGAANNGNSGNSGNSGDANNNDSNPPPPTSCNKNLSCAP